MAEKKTPVTASYSAKYNRFKDYNGRRYTGMKIGRTQRHIGTSGLELRFSRYIMHSKG